MLSCYIHATVNGEMILEWREPKENIVDQSALPCMLLHLFELPDQSFDKADFISDCIEGMLEQHLDVEP